MGSRWMCCNSNQNIIEHRSGRIKAHDRLNIDQLKIKKPVPKN